MYLATAPDSDLDPAIQIFQSADNGHSFAAPIDATPGPTSGESDKPWVTVDNYAGSNYGKVWLAYVYTGNGSPEIYLTTPNNNAGTNWPNQGDSTPSAGGSRLIASGSVFAPQVVVAPDHRVIVVYYDRFYYDSQSATTYPAIVMKWSGDGFATEHLLAQLNQSNSDLPNIDVSNGGAAPHIQGNVFPSATVNPQSGELFVAFTDLDGSGQPRVYFTEWIPGSASATGAEAIGLGGASSEQWQPSIAVSPNGQHALVGYYSQPNSDGQIYAYYSMAGVGVDPAQQNVDTLTWSAPTEITGPFQPPQVDARTSTITFMGDYDTTSADASNFYNSFTKTSGETFNVTGGGNFQQDDVYMDTIPIPYASAAPAAPTDPVFHPPVAETSSPPMITWAYSGDGSVTVYAEYSVAGGGWVTVGSTSASAGSITLSSNFTYDPRKTYYFRLRAQFDDGTDAAPAYSTVIQSWSVGTPSITSAVVDLTFQGHKDPANDKSSIIYTYLLHLGITWTGAEADYSNAFVQYRATATGPWIDLPTSTDLLTGSGGDIYISLEDSPLSSDGQFRLQLCNLPGGGAGLGGGLSAYTDPFTPTFDDPGTLATPVMTNVYSSNGYLTVNYNYWDFQANDTITLYGWDRTNFYAGSDTTGVEWDYLASCDGTQGTLNASLTAGDEYELVLYAQRVFQDSHGTTFTRTITSDYLTLTV